MHYYGASYFLTEATMNVKDLKTGTSTSYSSNYNDLKAPYQYIPGNTFSIFDIFTNTFYIMIIIILISILVIICYSLLFSSITNKNLIYRVGVNLSILLTILFILAIIYFALHLTLVQNESSKSVENLEGMVGFWCDVSYNIPSTDLSIYLNSGPGYAWYLMIICAILSVIGYGFIRKKSVVEPPITDFRYREKEVTEGDEEVQRNYQDEQG